MVKSLGCVLLTSVLGLTAMLAQPKTPPSKLVLAAKNGNVTFDHAGHVKRAKNDCAVCHPTLFAQDSKSPLGFKPPHKSLEDKKASCGSCHRVGGVAFGTLGNCANGKCHVRAAAAGK